MKRRNPQAVIGWREWVALPGLGIGQIKAKADTGARTSTLHAFDVKLVRVAGRLAVRFKVHPTQRDSQVTIACRAPLIDHRYVRSSTGRQTRRPVVLTPIELMGQRWDIELTLTNRDAMGFRMLLGREALRGLFVVDPGRSYLDPQHPAKPRVARAARSRRRAADRRQA